MDTMWYKSLESWNTTVTDLHRVGVLIVYMGWGNVSRFLVTIVIKKSPPPPKIYSVWPREKTKNFKTGVGIRPTYISSDAFKLPIELRTKPLRASWREKGYTYASS